MKQLTILLDCDDTISIFMETCIMKYNEIYGTNHTIEDITDWDISGIFEHNLWSIFDKTDVLQHMPLKDGAFDIINNPQYLYEWKHINETKLCLLMTAQHNKNKEYITLIRIDSWDDVDKYVNVYENILKYTR